MRFNAGEMVNVDGVGHCEVLRGDDPSLVTLRCPNGTTLKIGERALINMVRHDPETALHAQEQGRE